MASAGVPYWWEPLFRLCPNRSIFLSGDWIQTWLEVYGNEFEAKWVRWEHNGAVVGGCLLVTKMAWKWLFPMRSLYLNATGETARGTPLAEYNDILHLPGYKELIATDAARVALNMRWSRFHVFGYKEGALASLLVHLLPFAAVENDTSNANFVDFAAVGEKEFEASLSGKSGSQVRRNRRLHEEAYGNFEVVKARNLDEAMLFFSRLAALNNNRWQSKSQVGTFSKEAIVDFHERLIRRLWLSGAVDLICVRTNDKVFGYLYNFTTENKVYVFQTGFAYVDGSKLSPGIMTHVLCIEHYRLKGYLEYDFLAGEALYKRALAKHARPLFWTVVFRNSTWMRVLLMARSVKSALENFHKVNPTRNVM